MADIAALFTSIALPVMPEVGLALINTLFFSLTAGTFVNNGQVGAAGGTYSNVRTTAALTIDNFAAACAQIPRYRSSC